MLLHLLPLAFDLPASAANTSPFSTAIFRVESLELRPLEALLAGAFEARALLWGLLPALAVFGCWSSARLRRAVARIWTRFTALPRRAFLAGLLSAQLLLLLSLAVFTFDRMPHVQDSIGQVFQARIFAGGRLWSAPFPASELFGFSALVQGDKWYSKHPPGLPLMLAPFVALGVPWLLNPLLGTGCTYWIFRIGETLRGAAAARIAGLLALLAPFHAFMSASLMNHTLALFGLLVFGYSGLARAGSRALPVAGGASLGIALATRPLTALAGGAAWTLLAFARRETVGGFLRTARCWTIGLAPPLALFMAYNTLTSGGPLTLGYHVAADYHRLGFEGVPYPYTPALALVKSSVLFRALNEQLFAWPLPSLWLAFVVLARGASWRDLGLLGCALAVPAAYFFYWYQGMALGPRFAYESLPFWILLSAAALSSAPRPRGGAALGFSALALLLLLCVGWSLAFRWPELVERYSDSYWRTDRAMIERVEEAGLRQAVVMPSVRTCHAWYYGSGFWANDPFSEGDVLYARDRGPQSAETLARAYPRRSIHRYDCRADRLVRVRAARRP